MPTKGDNILQQMQDVTKVHSTH